MADEIDFQVADALELLARTPATLRAMLAGIADRWATHNYGADTFSPFDVVGHLIHGEKTDWIVRARQILAAGTGEAFAPFDRYAMYDASRGKTIDQLLDEFDTLRQRNLQEVNGLALTADDLHRCGRHPEFGEVTLAQLLATWVVHDLNHIHQIAKCMAHQYRNTVGPWRAYLTILPRE